MSTSDTPLLAPVVTSIDGKVPRKGLITNDTTPTIVGTGNKGNTIQLADHDWNVIASDVVDHDGNWSLTTPHALTEGGHNLTLIQTDWTNSSDALLVDITINTDMIDPSLIVEPDESDEQDDKSEEDEFGFDEEKFTIDDESIIDDEEFDEDREDVYDPYEEDPALLEEDDDM